MGPTTINGLPAHVLLLHVVVVLVPLSALLLALSVLWPAAHRKLGFITPLVALVTMVSVPLTTHAGEWLYRRTPPTPILRHHAHLGHQMLYWSIAVFVLSALWWLRRDRRSTAWLDARVHRSATVIAGRAVAAVLIVCAVAAAAGSVVLIYRIGDSGAHSVWDAG